MSDKKTYTAVLLGPNPMGEGEERELEFVNGEYQPTVVVEYNDPDGTIKRTYVLEAKTEEPIPYRFVNEHDTGGEPFERN